MAELKRLHAIGARSAVVTEGSFILDGEEYNFRRFADAAEYVQLEKTATEYIASISAKRVPPEVASVLPLTSSVVRMCVYCSTLITDPEGTVWDWASLSKTAGFLVPAIFTKLMQEVNPALAETVMNEVNAAKND